MSCNHLESWTHTTSAWGNKLTRQNLVKFSIKAEEYGFDSLWVLERLLSPINPQTPYPATPDGRLPADYQTVPIPRELCHLLSEHRKNIIGDICHKYAIP